MAAAGGWGTRGGWGVLQPALLPKFVTWGEAGAGKLEAVVLVSLAVFTHSLEQGG